MQQTETKFQVGDRVKVIPSPFLPRPASGRYRIEEIDFGKDGHARYWLAGGGLFYENELEKA